MLSFNGSAGRGFKAVVLAGALCFCLVDVPDRALATETPVVAFSFNEGEGPIARDSFGSHDGTLDGAEWTEAGKYGGAIEFDGEDDTVTVFDSDELDLTDEFTLEAWVRVPEAREWGPILSKEDPGESPAYLFYAQAWGGPYGYIFDEEGNEKARSGSEALPVDAWTHLAFTSDGEEMSLYVNGQLDTSGESFAAKVTAGDLQIGASKVFNEYFKGEIDEVRLYDRVLGEEEISEDMEVGIGPAPRPDPVAAFSFNEGEGPIARDSFGSHDGTLDGAEWTEAGKYGGAIEFDGEDDLITIPDSNDLDLTGSFTLEAWIRLDQRRPWASILTKETSGGWFGYQLYGEGGTEAPVGYVTGEDWGPYAGATGSEAVPLATWKHLALTSDGEELRLYLDGELEATEAAMAAQASDGALQIGGNEVFSEYLDGRIDDVRIYERFLYGYEIEEDKTTAVLALISTSTPSIEGASEETRLLTAGPGKWKGRTPIGFVYQWERCSAEECADIPGATNATFKLGEEDVGSRLRVKVKATNVVESQNAVSGKTSVVVESPPRFETPVALSGTRTVGQTLTADTSGLEGSKPMSLSYEWERCIEYCADLEETDDTYKLVEQDAASQIRVRVTAENEAGVVSQRSVTSGYIDPAETEGKPALAKPPMLRGLRMVSGELTTTMGDWLGAGSIETSVQWERCGKELESCEDIVGATEEAYEIEPSDQGMRLRSRVTATNLLGEKEGFSAFTPRVLPAAYSVFTMETGVPLGEILEDTEAAEAKLVSFNYSGETSGIYLNPGLQTSEVLADFADKVDDEDAGERPVLSFTLWDEVASEALGDTGKQVSLRSEAPTLRANPPGVEDPPGPSTQEFLEGMVYWADMGAWSPADREEGDEDRALQGRFLWRSTSEEVLSYFEETESPMALEFDVKQINRGNSDPLDIQGKPLGICLPWEKNDFWIGTREYSNIDTNFPDSAGFYWDTALSDSCQEKDLSFGLYHPEALTPDELYEATIFFDGGDGSLVWPPLFPALDNETAIGDADASPFTWSLSMLGQHCDWSPWCVGIPGIDVPGEGFSLIKENQEFGEVDSTFKDYGPATFPGCFRFNNPLYPAKGKKPGVLPCQDDS